MAPTTIIEFLISLGGINDEGGDLRAMDLHRVQKGWFGRLAHKRGMSLDRAREACEEARYIRPDSMISDLIEAIGLQASGMSGLVPEERGDSYAASQRSPHPMDTLVRDGADFRAGRRTMGWTQKRAAAELDVSERAILGYENSGRPISRVVALACLALEAFKEEEWQMNTEGIFRLLDHTGNLTLAVGSYRVCEKARTAETKNTYLQVCVNLSDPPAVDCGWITIR